MARMHLRLQPVDWLLILALLQVVLAVAPASAQTSHWVNAGGGSYTKASNWDTANVPDVLGESAAFNLDDTYTVQILPSSSITINYLEISDGNVTFSTGNSLGDATLNAGQGILLSREGNLTLARVGVSTDIHLNTNNVIQIEGGSTLAILDGATFMADLLEVSMNNNNIGGPDGNIIVDGVGSTLTANSEVRLGAKGPFGTGTLTIQNGATVSSSNGHIGFDSGSTGIATIDGAGSTWMASNSLYVGGSNSSAAGTGGMTVTDQGLVDVAATLKIWNSGTVALDGGSIVTNALDNTEGGTFNFIAGSLTMNDALVIGTGGLLGENRTFGFNQSVTTTGTTTVEAGRLLRVDGGSLSTNNLIVNGGFYFDRGTLELTGGSIAGMSSLVIPANGEFRAAGFQTFQVMGLPGSTITPTGDLVVGSAGSLDGFNFAGRLDIGSHTVSLGSAGAAKLGALTTIDGGVLNASNGIVLGAGDSLDGNGTVADKVAAAAGSLIRVSTGIVTLELGDSTALDGFVSDGEIAAGAGTIRLLDANQAVLGSQNSLGAVVLPLFEFPGTIEAPNGAILDFGRGITGFGTVDTPDDPTRPTIVNGDVVGYDASHPLTFTGYVKGVGTFDNVVITGTDAPGFSPATVIRGRVAYDGVLEIELGGTTLGSFDRLQHILGAGIASLSGALDVSFLNGFTPALNDTFEIITAIGGVNGVFSTMANELPVLGANLEWQIDYGTNNVVLAVVSAAVAGDFDVDGDVDGRDFLVWQRNPSVGNLSDWQTNYGIPPLSATATAVPEPSTWLLLSLAVVGSKLTRRLRIA